MFMEIITVPRAHYELVAEKSRVHVDTPAGLLSSVVWEAEDGKVTWLTVWATPSARGDFAAERLLPFFQSGVFAELKEQPRRLAPVHVFVRENGDTGLPRAE